MPDGSRTAAILATYSDWRPVKGRKALQLVFEVPLEQQEEVLRILGAPLPDREQWVGIALVDKAKADAPEPAPARSTDRSEQAKAQYAGKSEWQKAATRAAMLCKDKGFQDWAAPNPHGYTFHDHEREAQAAFYLRTACGIESRSEIGTDEGAFNRFLALETDWKIHNRELPRPR